MAKVTDFKALLERARANVKAARDEEYKQIVDARLQELAAEIEARNITHVDLSLMGFTDEQVLDPEQADLVADAIRDTLVPCGNDQTAVNNNTNSSPASNVIGVARDVTLNKNQLRAKVKIINKESCCVIGAAGTGKTTSMRQITRALIDLAIVPKLREGSKWLKQGDPGIAVVSFTNKAVNNIRHAVVDELKRHTVTVHKLLEFAPIFYEVLDEKTGTMRNTMRFEPQRCISNPLPADLKLVIYEESSMIGVPLYDLLQDAMPHEHQEVFLGDIQQLPPVFGLAILGFKMLELPVIELTEVYRQALESPIIALAWKLLEGNPHEFSSKTEKYETWSDVLNKKVTRIRCPALDKFTQVTDAGALKFQVWQKQLSTDIGVFTTVKQFCAWADDGYYNPEEDIILCPFNQAFGTIEINRGIAQYLGVKRGATVYEVIAGFRKHYLAVGDRVLYDKEDAFITAIHTNGSYLGQKTQPASIHLDRNGALQKPLTAQEQLQAQIADDEINLEQIEQFMQAAAEASEDRVQAASHTITIQFAYGDDMVITLDQAAQVNNLLGGYDITVHK